MTWKRELLVLIGSQKKGSYRFVIPFLGKIKVNAMDDQENVDDDKKMVWIPESIEPGEFFKGYGEIQLIPPKPRGG